MMNVIMNKKEYDRNRFKNLSREERDKINARSREYRKRKRVEDPDYRENVNKKQREWHQKNPQAKSLISKKVRINQRVRLAKILGGKCEDCGIYEYEIMHFGHRNDDGSKDRKRFSDKNGKFKAEKMYVYYIRNPEEAKQKLKLQCANCNWRQRFKRT